MKRTERRCTSVLAAAVARELRGRSPTFAMLGTLALVAAGGLEFSATAHAGNTYFVDTAGDPGPPGTQSLRQAVALANASILGPTEDNSIVFDSSLVGSTITLMQGEISISQAVHINGPIEGRLTISGANTSRIFHASSATSDRNSWPVVVQHLTLTQGHTEGCGGAVYAKNMNFLLLFATVTDSSAILGGGACALGVPQFGIEYSRISGNVAVFGGGVYAASGEDAGILVSTISGNSAGRYGGGVDAVGVGRLTIAGSLIMGNTVPAPGQNYYPPQGGGGIAISASSLLLRTSTLCGNYAYTG